MYITPNNYAQIFREIKRTSSSHSVCKLIIFVSCLDIDSICTGKILSILFKKNLIQYQLIPIVGYSDLKNHYSQLDEEVSNVLLIGCGAMVDIEEFFNLNPENYVVNNEPGSGSGDLDLNDDLSQAVNLRNLKSFRRKIYIIDGHRPWNLDNIFNSDMIICFDDGHIDGNLLDERQAYEEVMNDYNEHGDESEIELSTEETEEDEREEGEQDDDDEIRHKRRKIELSPAKQRKQQIIKYEEMISNYYNQGTTVITSNTATIYALLASIGETNLENLWLSIIGTTSLDNHYPEVYDKIQPLFKDEVFRLNPSNINSSNSSDKTADSTSLSIEKDYHLFLLRHWTLYDSFFYSSHVNSKLNLWTEDGRKKLHKLFAKMGVSLYIAQQKWLYMDINIKKQLPVIFNKYLPSYGLEGIVREGFIRTYGYAGQLSAMECVESLTALLECDKRLLSDEKKPPSKENEDDVVQMNEKLEERGKIWANNFWSSWDALNSTNSNNGKIVSSNLQTSANSITNFKKLKGLDLLLEGLNHAKKIQQIIFKTGMSLLERKLIKNLRLYRLCVLNDGSIPDLAIFNNPLILSKLGGWLLDNITEIEFSKFDENNITSLKPLVVASLDVESDTYLVIGLAPKYPRGMDNAIRAKLLQEQKKRKRQQENEEKGIDLDADEERDDIDQSTLTTRLNTFSVAFHKVAEQTGAEVRIDSFDRAVIEVKRDDLSPFLEKLTLSGLI